MIRVVSFASLVVLLSACAPGLDGRWDLSGDIDHPEYKKFSGTLTVDEDGEGRLWYAFDGGSREEVPLCQVSRSESELIFVVDGNQPPTASCDSLPTPLSFRGKIGEHVLVGDVQGADKKAVGHWRAFRAVEH